MVVVGDAAGDRPSCRRHPRCHSAVGGVADRF